MNCVTAILILQFCFFVVSKSDSLLGNAPIKYPTHVMVEMENYTSESHYVTTEDGYNLNIHRIPTGKYGQTNGKVVLLQHGLEDSSAGWILAGPGKALGYILADEGYDVWLGNSRGNFYSRNHTILDPDKDSEFWHFSWHEMGIYDLPATIDYILEQTGQESLYYVAHSQGSTSMYVMCSLKPEYNEKIKFYAHLSPIAFMDHLYSPLIRFVASIPSLPTLVSMFGVNEFFSTKGYFSQLLANICAEYGTISCKNGLFAIFGFSQDEMNTSLVPLIMVHLPAGAAIRQIMHFGQEIESGYFRQYDYGLMENIGKYHRFSPPDYELNKVTAPGYLFYANNDWVCSITDVDRLSSRLNNLLGKKLIPKKTFSHLDFLFGVNAHELVYKDILEIFSKY